ncbi:hypothetical protein ASG62_08105 [Aureimonas sp. Leaf427]|nr:hypothetical protein ASG62_08105 [Aureimonas sp. Leaf427]
MVFFPMGRDGMEMQPAIRRCFGITVGYGWRITAMDTALLVSALQSGEARFLAYPEYRFTQQMGKRRDFQSSGGRCSFFGGIEIFTKSTEECL